MENNLDNIDKIFVTNGGLKFEKDNTRQEIILNDDGIMDMYTEGKLMKSVPFSKLALLRECKTLTQEGYKIYINNDYNSTPIKEVETEEEAEKLVDKLTKQGHDVSYKEDEELTEAELATNKEEVEKDKSEVTSDNIDTKATKEELEQQIEDVKEIQDLKQELEDEVDKLNEGVHVSDYGNILCSYEELEKTVMPRMIERLKKVLPDYDWNYRIEWISRDGHINIYDKDENFDFVEQLEDVEKINDIIIKIFKSDDVYIEPVNHTIGEVAEVLVEDGSAEELTEDIETKKEFPSTKLTQEILSYNKLNDINVEEKLSQEQKDYINSELELTPNEFKEYLLELMDMIGDKDTNTISIDEYIEELGKEENK